MVLILGALGAGKKAYARSLGYTDEQMRTEVDCDAPVLLDLEEAVRTDPKGTEAAFARICQKELVLCREIGSGVIPLDPTERDWRERTGRLCARLAKEASTVVRVIAGIPVAIKGELPCR